MPGGKKKILSLSFAKHAIIFLCIFFSFSSIAQFYSGSQQSFGKNKVQYNQYFWTYYRYDRFEVYFYQEGKNLALFTAKTANTELAEVEKLFDYSLERKIQFIVFNKYTDFKQSNIGFISEEQYNTGGITYIAGNKVLIYFEGDHKKLRQQIKAGIAEIMINELLFGDNVGSNIKNSTLMAVPDWYINGLASYISVDWDEEVDNVVRDGILSKRFEKFNNLEGGDATYAGHSIWKFVADRYGKNVLSNILYMTRISRSIENGFLFVLGVSLKNLAKDWINYYDSRYYFQDKDRTLPKKEELFKKGKKDVVFEQFKTSPDGKYAVYVTNELGKNRVWLYNFDTKKRKKILKNGFKLDFKNDFSYPILAWHPTSELFSVITEKNGKLFLMQYTISDRQKVYIRLMNIEKILSFDYSDDGTMFVLSGIQNGKSDIFVYNNIAHVFEQITNDGYDDLYAHFANNSKEILFSSNRNNDTIHYDEQNIKPQKNNDIFIFDYSSKTNILKRLTNTPLTDEIFPMEYDNRKNYCYISNENGIYNKYLAHIDSIISFVDTVAHYRYNVNSYPFTNYSRNIREFEINLKQKKSTEIIFANGRYSLYQSPLVKADSLSPQKLLNTYYKEDQIKENSLSKSPDNSDKTTFERARKKKKKTSNVTSNPKNNAPDTFKIDINDYKFGNEVYENNEKENNTPQTDSTVNKVKKDSAFAYVPKQRNYDVAYNINQIVYQLNFAYLNDFYEPMGQGNYKFPGFNALLMLGVTDLLEDYRIAGGTVLPINFNSSEYLLSYESLKRRIDEQYILHRQTIPSELQTSILKYYINEGYYILKYPFSEISSVRGTITLRNERKVYKSFMTNDDNLNLQNLTEPHQYTTRGGVKIEYIFDNTKNKALNIYYGLRFKVFGEYYKVLDQKKTNLYTLGLDIRHYKKIFKTFIWANRFAGCTSFGDQRVIFFMGGVDNWLSPKFENMAPIHYEENYAYMTRATNVRGFKVNVRNGSNFALINSELRFPVFKCLINRPIKSDFISNFQIIGFGDIGAAWIGWNPYSDENTLFIEEINKYPFKIVIENKENPIIEGLGFGLRSRLLGYFVRADWAWGIRNGIVQPKMFYISLSLDF
ncbi:MAG: hypothetical protein PHD97_03960 [Bacteroidales bacterium]|nr:hypothetical protein [Bacteroidales bacterium]